MATIYRGVREDSAGADGQWWAVDEYAAKQFGDTVIEREMPERIHHLRPAVVKWIGELDSRNHGRMVELFEAICEAKHVSALYLPDWDYGSDCVWICG